MILIGPSLYPEKNTKVMIVNTNWIFTTFWKVIKLVIPAEFDGKIEILGQKETNKELIKYLGKETVPSNFGGEGPKI
jgi:hypothetical protein